MINFSESDLEQLSRTGISQEKVLKQIDTFKDGIPMIHLEKAAVVADGISKFNKTEEKGLIKEFELANKTLKLLKFVPASGAASRMFKDLFNFLETFNPDKETYSSYIDRTGATAIEAFFRDSSKLPFTKLVNAQIKGKAKSEDEEKLLFVRELLSENGLNFGIYPKGLLPFHNYGSYSATPFEEHLREAAEYASVKNEAHLHFTISEQHMAMFKQQYVEIEDRVRQETSTKFQLGYSFQKSSTDTIAVALDNQPFRNADGSLLFRPGGHGALIENLNEQDADIIFIKNIDNVVVPQYLDEVAFSKKVLAGLLVNIQKMAFHYANLLDTENISGEDLSALKNFLEQELNVRFSAKFHSYSLGEQLAIYKDKINRPIRICGMVKNEGEPGGGPFWIRDEHNNVSLQIIESAQVDMTDNNQLEIFKNSTHFNPVDLVCGVKNHKGEKYNLLNFVDYKQGFITSKTKDGKDLKALELPGLWNGAMAFWNTVFVEVPLITFNPVKTVNDLLKPAHQIS